MKKYLLFLLLLSCNVIALAQNDKEPYQTQSLSADNIKNAKIETSGGSILVAGGDASSARLEVYITANGSNDKLSKEEIQQRLTEMYELNIAVSNGKLTAI